MPHTEMVVMIAMTLFMLIGFVFLLRLFKAWLLHRTLRDAIARDSASAGELIARIERADTASRPYPNDDRNGLVLLALGLAGLGFSLVIGNLEWARYVRGAALFPLLVGAALLGRHFWQRHELSRDAAGGA